MRQIIFILFTLFFCSSINGQDGTPEFFELCGDPQNESILTSKFVGKVKKIIDSDTAVIKVENEELVINLAAVDTSSNEKKSKKFLTKKILNKNVYFYIYGIKKDKDEIFADIFYENVYSASRSLITKGIARFKKPDTYAFSNNKACIYQRLEEIAKKEKLGIWAK